MNTHWQINNNIYVAPKVMKVKPSLLPYSPHHTYVCFLLFFFFFFLLFFSFLLWLISAIGKKNINKIASLTILSKQVVHSTYQNSAKLSEQHNRLKIKDFYFCTGTYQPRYFLSFFFKFFFTFSFGRRCRWR